MQLLLDTHVWVWAVLRPEKLGKKMRRELEAPRNELYLSPVSIWEAHRISQGNRLKLKQPFAEWFNLAMTRVPVQEAQFNFAVASEAGRISLPQSDIGDVFLAATASVFGMTLATADEQLLGCKWLSVLAND